MPKNINLTLAAPSFSNLYISSECLYGLIDSTKLILETLSAGKIETIIETPIPIAYESRIVVGLIRKDTLEGTLFCISFILRKGIRNFEVKIYEAIIPKVVPTVHIIDA